MKQETRESAQMEMKEQRIRRENSKKRKTVCLACSLFHPRAQTRTLVFFFLSRNNRVVSWEEDGILMKSPYKWCLLF